MLTIFHNPRCSKSRQTLQLIQDKLPQGESITIVEYLKNPLNKKQLRHIIDLLQCEVRDIMRTSETDYKENNLANKNLSENQLLEAMVTMPKLMQRPIVVNGNKAAIGRPPENVLTIL